MQEGSRWRALVDASATAMARLATRPRCPARSLDVAEVPTLPE